MPTTFFLIIINITYSFFDTFGIIDTTTIGAPGSETKTLVYKAYIDGFKGLDLFNPINYDEKVDCTSRLQFFLAPQLLYPYFFILANNSNI